MLWWGTALSITQHADARQQHHSTTSGMELPLNVTLTVLKSLVRLTLSTKTTLVPVHKSGCGTMMTKDAPLIAIQSKMLTQAGLVHGTHALAPLEMNGIQSDINVS